MNTNLDPSPPDELRPLEAELRSMRPAALPAEMDERVARALEGSAGKPRAGLWLAAGVLGAAMNRKSLAQNGSQVGAILNEEKR